MEAASPELWAKVDMVKSVFPGATVIQVRTPRQRLADLIRHARQEGDHDRAIDLRERWRERAAIREYDGNQTREHAEAESLREILDMSHPAQAPPPPEPEDPDSPTPHGVTASGWAMSLRDRAAPMEDVRTIDIPIDNEASRQSTKETKTQQLRLNFDQPTPSRAPRSNQVPE